MTLQHRLQAELVLKLTGSETGQKELRELGDAAEEAGKQVEELAKQYLNLERGLADRNRRFAGITDPAERARQSALLERQFEIQGDVARRFHEGLGNLFDTEERARPFRGRRPFDAATASQQLRHEQQRVEALEAAYRGLKRVQDALGDTDEQSSVRREQLSSLRRQTREARDEIKRLTNDLEYLDRVDVEVGFETDTSDIRRVVNQIEKAKDDLVRTGALATTGAAARPAQAGVSGLLQSVGLALGAGAAAGGARSTAGVGAGVFSRALRAGGLRGALTYVLGGAALGGLLDRGPELLQSGLGLDFAEEQLRARTEALAVGADPRSYTGAPYAVAELGGVPASAFETAIESSQRARARFLERRRRIAAGQEVSLPGPTSNLLTGFVTRDPDLLRTLQVGNVQEVAQALINAIEQDVRQGVRSPSEARANLRDLFGEQGAELITAAELQGRTFQDLFQLAIERSVPQTPGDFARYQAAVAAGSQVRRYGRQTASFLQQIPLTAAGLLPGELPRQDIPFDAAPFGNVVNVYNQTDNPIDEERTTEYFRRALENTGLAR